MTENEKEMLSEMIECIKQLREQAEILEKMNEKFIENVSKWEAKYRTALCLIVEEAQNVGPDAAVEAAFDMLICYNYNREQREHKYIYSQVDWKEKV